MSAHEVTIDLIDEGRARFALHCHHAADDPAWVFRDPPDEDGERGEPTGDEGCWLLEGWWEPYGDELLMTGPVLSVPFPVCPSDDWDYDDGGSLVLDNPESFAAGLAPRECLCRRSEPYEQALAQVIEFKQAAI